MNDLDNIFSTTKCFTRNKPTLESDPEYKLTSQLTLPANKNRKGYGGVRNKSYFKKSYKNKPLISVVTVVYQGKKYLNKTINSVLDQAYDNVEYIIIDGGSTDGTLDIIKQYDECIDYWVSEPDTGIYNAMNKGIGLCTGEYVAFLNADDWYNTGALQSVADLICSNRYDYIYGDISLIKDGVSARVITPGVYKYKIDMPICHQALFVKKSILLKLGFNEDYKILADYDLVLQLINSNYSSYYLNEILANFRYGGLSSTTDKSGEYFKVLSEHFGLLHAVFRYIVRSKNPVLFFIGKLAIKLKLRIFFTKFYTFLGKSKNIS